MRQLISCALKLTRNSLVNAPNVELVVKRVKPSDFDDTQNKCRCHAECAHREDDNAKQVEDEAGADESAVDNQVTFTIPAPWLTAVSSYFEEKLNDKWIDGYDHTIEINDTDPELFAISVEWLFGRKLLHPEGVSYVEKVGQQLKASTACAQTLEALFSAYYELLLIYGLAVKYGIPMLRRDALDTLLEIINRSRIPPPPGMVRWSYEWFPTIVVPLHKAMVNSYPRFGASHRVKKCAGINIPEDFFVGIAVEMQRFPGCKPPYNPCDYHEHNEDAVEAAMKVLEEKEKAGSNL